jgi:hypothetical protein
VIDTLRPEDAELLEEIANRLDHDDILFGNPKWLENFREMKQAAIDSLYKDDSKCPKHWAALHFNLQLLICKVCHGWTDTSFNDLLFILGDTYPEGNKVPINTYRAKKLIRPVAIKLEKFHACPNHCILYQGKYENL